MYIPLKIDLSLLYSWSPFIWDVDSQFGRQKFPLRALTQHSYVLRTGLSQFQVRGLKPPVIFDLIPHPLISFWRGYAAS